MFAKDYARTYRANAVLTASPGQLVLMMYDGALRALALAQEAFSRPPQDLRRLEAINQQLVKAQQIIAQLDGALNFDVGDGQFAREMQRLYDYYSRRLLEANLRKQVEPVIEVERLLTEVRNAWAEMLRNQDRTPAPALAQTVA
ncbi:MAG TPA: flagellar export chaperone FliS [Candidatus Didemnitutus sp.]|nr:flagellar export chaperone FliS [Candidatus Didemnitutus sp.]